MDSLPRKRKGALSACSFAESRGGDGRRKKTRRQPEKAAVMTAPPASGAGSPESPGRGLKRKVGCIDAATRLGRKRTLEREFAVGDQIGHGKFGSVRICRARAGNAAGEEFACKSLPKNGEETVHREVEIMQHLSGHPGIVTLKAVFEDDEKIHLVMELCGGGRLLDQMAKEGRFSEQLAANVIKELVLVIKYCHEMGVVHRDIKPENILLTKHGKMKLADFGLAARVTNGQKLSGVVGSPAYVAPEVLLGQYSEKVDVWGAGVLLHALLLGALPFQGGSMEDVFEAIKTAELDFQSGPWKSVSFLARDLISRMLNRDVSSRIDVDEILSHPWIVFYTGCPVVKAVTTDSHVTNKAAAPSQCERIKSSQESSSSESLRYKSEEQDICGIVDALTTAITRIRISEPKRSRICSPALPVQQECSSNLKTNLCPVF